MFVGSGGHCAIQASDLVKHYRGGVRALDRLSFQVAPGTVFGLLGPNGAGKSTTVKILTTLSRPDSGGATVAGIDVLAHPGQVRQGIGVVTQRSGIDLEATGRENIALAAHLHGLARAELATRVTDLLDRFELAQAADRPARTYSGGMLRKLDVAVGLVHRPSVLFLDEPTTGLDPHARMQMWDEIGSLAADGLTIMLTTHYLEEADRLASRVAIIDGGRILVEGSPDELKSELRGDAVRLELATVPDAALAEGITMALNGIPGVTETTLDGREVHSRVTNGASSLPAVFAALEQVDTTVIAATIARPSLDDVYLRHVGHRFRATAGTGPRPAGVGAGTGAGTDDTNGREQGVARKKEVA
ncbi:ATP-binding cassette domain-containing protein [Frankia sp. Cj3]|uniref:ATP-binding cassette domain-containing protein n=1 Tax=unclassified Frankia TaxID=2632575 RepID=UPI00351D128A